MANPWDNDPVVSDSASPANATPWANDAVEKPAYSGSVLPFSRDQQGNVHFDSNAGVLGMAKSMFGTAKDAATLPGDVYAGKVDPTSDEGIGRAFGLAGLVAPSGSVTKAANVAAPTADALHAAASAGYKDVRDMGVDYSGQHVSALAKALQSGLESDGVLGELAPKSFSILGKLQDAPAGSVAPIASLDAARKSFGYAAKDFTNPTEQLAAKRAIDGIDGFIAQPPEGGVVAGPAAAAGDALAEARGNYAAAMRSDRINGIGEAADLGASAANSGLNLDNSIRQRVKSLILNPKQSAGYSPDELAALEEVVRGTPGRNAARYIGNLFGGGGGLGAIASAAAGGAGGSHFGSPILGGIALGALPTTGYAAKYLANALTSKALGSADQLVRQRSPLFDALTQAAAPVVKNDSQRGALMRALLSAPTNNQQMGAP